MLKRKIGAVMLAAVMIFASMGEMRADAAPAGTGIASAEAEAESAAEEEDGAEADSAAETAEETEAESDPEKTEDKTGAGAETETEDNSGEESAEKAEGESDTESAKETEEEPESGDEEGTEEAFGTEMEFETLTEPETESETLTESVTETETESVTEWETESGLEDEETESLFPGLDGRNALSASMLAEKALLEEYADELDGMEEGEDFNEGEIIVSARSREEAQTYAEAYGGELADYTDGAALILLPAGRLVRQAVKASAQEEVLLPAAWPNYRRYLFEGEGDPYLNPGSLNYQYYHSMISSDAAWRAGDLGGGVRVAVLDTGIKTGHEDVTAQAFDNGAGGSYSFGTEDSHGHGTHVAGIIGAALDNGKGGSGVAPGAELISVKVTNDRGTISNVWSLRCGIRQAIDNGADIINMSLGGPGYSLPEEEAVREAYESGIAVFAAAGNESSSSFYYPASYDGAFSVAALNENMGLARFSNYGKAVDYCAPGVGIWSAGCTGVSAYKSLSGTSQATPIVAGEAAVLLASDVMPKNLSGVVKVEALRRLLDKGAVKIAAEGTGKGYVNLARALDISNAQTAPKAPVFGKQSGTVFSEESARISITAEPGMQIFYAVNAGALTCKNGVLSEGAETYAEPVTIEGAAKVTVQALAVNPANGLAGKAVKATYYLKPLVREITVRAAYDVNTVMQGKSIRLSAQTAPSYAANRKVVWSVSPSTLGVKIDQDGLMTAGAKAPPGRYWVTATAQDEGKVSSESFPVEVCEKGGTMISSIRAAKTAVTVYAGQETQIAVTVKRGTESASVNDLVWSSNAEATAAAAADSEGEAVVIRGKRAGKTTVIGRAADGSGKTIKLTVTVKQYAESVTITGASGLAVGKSIALKAAVTPGNAGSKKVRWSIRPADGGSGVQVSASGRVTAKRTAQPGVYIVTATAADGSGVFAEKEIEVLTGAIKRVAFEKKSASIFRVENRYGARNAVILPLQIKTSNGIESQEWTVTGTNSGIATVSRLENAVRVEATGRATGKVKVTVKTTDGSGLSATCVVTVSNPATRLMLAPQSGRSYQLAKGKSMKLTAVLESASGALAGPAKKLMWSSSNDKVVAVDKSGRVTAKAASGSVVITAEATDGSGVRATYTVSATEPVRKITTGAYGTYEGLVGVSARIPVELVRADENNPFCKDLVTAVSGNSVTTKIIKNADGSIVLYVAMNKKGKARITVRCMDGSTAARTISVVVK